MLLVASGGGHLEQLVCLTPRIVRSWGGLAVTYDTPQSRSRLSGYRLIGAHHPTTKNPINAARNYRLARRVFASHEITRVISTGAAVAVPFLARARQLGIPCHYIESATRVSGPSLSGRILQRMPGVHLYRQTGAWGAQRWQQGPCVFDGYSTSAAEERPPRRIVVSLGTHHFGFDAAADALEAVLRGRHEVETLWQLGATTPQPYLAGRTVDQLPADELERAIERSDVVVGHAGVGLALTSLAAGKVPVLVPRRKARGEHTDDHQVQLAQELDRRGLAVVAEVGELTFEHLERAAALSVTYEPPPPFELVD